MSHSKPTNPFDATYDAATAHAAFDAVRSRLDVMSTDAVLNTNVDLHAAATIALAVARFVDTPDARARFARLPKEHFDATVLELLPASAWATWYAHTQYLSASAGSEARVPAALAQHSTELKQRMLRVLEYHTDEAAELASIRLGSGYLDLATDLARLASLYRKHKKDIAEDKRHYRAGDEKDATESASKIVNSLGEGLADDGRAWQRWQGRAWTLLSGTYGEVRAAGLWLFRNEEGEEKFPSLVTATRAHAAHRKGDAGESGSEGSAGSEGTKKG
jgi:hypothetical protein